MNIKKRFKRKSEENYKRHLILRSAFPFLFLCGYFRRINTRLSSITGSRGKMIR